MGAEGLGCRPGLEAQQVQGHDGQIIRELKAPEALAGMHGRNCKQIVVKPERRGGYMPSQVMISAVTEAKRRGIPIDERIHAP